MVSGLARSVLLSPPVKAASVLNEATNKFLAFSLYVRFCTEPNLTRGTTRNFERPYCGRGKFLFDQASSTRKRSHMNDNLNFFRACFALTLFCGIGAIAIAIFGPSDANPLVSQVQNVLVTLFGLGAGAFFFKGLGG